MAKTADPASKQATKKASHPPCTFMVAEALTALKSRSGSSLPAIKKFIADKYQVDVGKLAPFIRKALKSGVEAQKIVTVKSRYKLAKNEQFK